MNPNSFTKSFTTGVKGLNAFILQNIIFMTYMLSERLLNKETKLWAEKIKRRYSQKDSLRNAKI